MGGGGPSREQRGTWHGGLSQTKRNPQLGLVGVGGGGENKEGPSGLY